MKDMWRQLQALPRPAKIGLSVFGGVLTFILMAALISSNSDLNSQLDAASEREEALEREIAEAESQIDALNEEASEARAEARTESRRAARAMKIARKEVLEEFAGRQAQLDQREGNLDSRAAALSQEEEREKMRIIKGDGIWQTDVDFAAGTYRSTGRGSCYWAKLSDPGGEFESIIANGNGVNQTVTIDSPWFESSGCGTWEPIG